MEEKQILKIIDKDGKERDAEVLLYFTLNESGKDYVIYTYNETEGDLVVVNTSVVTKDENGELVLDGITDNDEWAKIKEVMREVIKENKE